MFAEGMAGSQTAGGGQMYLTKTFLVSLKKSRSFKLHMRYFHRRVFFLVH